MLDPNGPDGAPLPLLESGAILIYLADKSGKFLPKAAAARYQTIQWLMWQLGGVGPLFGQLGFFHPFAGKDYADQRPPDPSVAGSRGLPKDVGRASWWARMCPDGEPLVVAV